jgi:hypothetical protein
VKIYAREKDNPYKIHTISYNDISDYIILRNKVSQPEDSRTSACQNQGGKSWYSKEK